MTTQAAPAPTVTDDVYTGAARTIAASQLPSPFVQQTGGTTRATPNLLTFFSPVYYPPLKGPVG